MERLRLIVSDVDRTLLTHDYRLPERVAAAIARARDAGVSVVLVTARSPAAVRPYAEALGLGGLAVCFNGGWTGNVSTAEAIESHPIPRAAAVEAMEAAEAAGVDGLWFQGGVVHALADTPGARREVEITGEALAVAPGVGALPGEPDKILCVAAGADGAERFARLRALLGDGVEASASHPRLLEIVPARVSKRAALERLAARLRLRAGECAAAGDAENDLGMMAWAGTAVTVGNAIAEARALASFVGPSCDAGGLADGVAWLLEQARAGAAA